MRPRRSIGCFYPAIVTRVNAGIRGFEFYKIIYRKVSVAGVRGHAESVNSRVLPL
jgi:hypothetical protein